jgi:hypothetical protein
VAGVVGQAAAERERRSNNASSSTDVERTGLDPRLGTLADEDNIGFGE